MRAGPPLPPSPSFLRRQNAMAPACLSLPGVRVVCEEDQPSTEVRGGGDREQQNWQKASEGVIQS